MGLILPQSALRQQLVILLDPVTSQLLDLYHGVTAGPCLSSKSPLVRNRASINLTQIAGHQCVVVEAEGLLICWDDG